MTLEFIQSNSQVRSTRHTIYLISSSNMLEFEWLYKGHSLFPTGSTLPTLSHPVKSYISIISLIFKGHECVTLPWFNLTPSIQNQRNAQKVNQVHPSSWSVLVAMLGMHRWLSSGFCPSLGPLHHPLHVKFYSEREPAFEYWQ